MASPWIGISLLVIILVIICINLYYTWWLYSNTRSNQDNFDDTKEDIREIADFLFPDREPGECVDILPVDDNICKNKNKKKNALKLKTLRDLFQRN